MIGWYLAKGPLTDQRLRGKRADVYQTGKEQYAVQFDDKENLPLYYTHGRQIFHANQIVCLLEEIEEHVYLEHKGKKYHRKLRNGKFTFHNQELTLQCLSNSETPALTTTASEQKTTEHANN